MPSLSTSLKIFGLYLVIAGLSFFGFSRLLPVSSGTDQDPTSPQTSNGPTTGVLKFPGPKTEVCPLNGQKYTKEEADIWSARRPLTVMIENQADSRPQSGLDSADIVYEAVAEGGITRFMGVFYCDAAKGSDFKYDLGPVRSARTYFLDLASEYADYPLYTHVGGANCSGVKDPVTGREGACTTYRQAQAIEQISDYGWMNKGTWGDLSQFSLPYKACRREPDRTGQVRDTEHTMYCSSTELWNIAADRGLTATTEINKTAWDKNYRPWIFTQTDQATSPATANFVNFDFWPGYKDYSVSWQYQADQNLYLRSNAGQTLTDFNTKQTLSTKNLIIQFVKETRSVDEHGHNLYAVVGSGKGVLVQNGTWQNITWSKAKRQTRTTYLDSSGKEIKFVPGKIWVEIVPLNTAISYESGQPT